MVSRRQGGREPSLFLLRRCGPPSLPASPSPDKPQALKMPKAGMGAHPSPPSTQSYGRQARRRHRGERHAPLLLSGSTRIAAAMPGASAPWGGCAASVMRPRAPGDGSSATILRMPASRHPCLIWARGRLGWGPAPRLSQSRKPSTAPSSGPGTYRELI